MKNSGKLNLKGIQGDIGDRPLARDDIYYDIDKDYLGSGMSLEVKTYGPLRKGDKRAKKRDIGDRPLAEGDSYIDTTYYGEGGEERPIIAAAVPESTPVDDLDIEPLKLIEKTTIQK